MRIWWSDSSSWCLVYNQCLHSCVWAFEFLTWNLFCERWSHCFCCQGFCEILTVQRNPFLKTTLKKSSKSGLRRGHVPGKGRGHLFTWNYEDKVCQKVVFFFLSRTGLLQSVASPEAMCVKTWSQSMIGARRNYEEKVCLKVVLQEI